MTYRRFNQLNQKWLPKVTSITSTCSKVAFIIVLISVVGNSVWKAPQGIREIIYSFAKTTLYGNMCKINTILLSNGQDGTFSSTHWLLVVNINHARDFRDSAWNAELDWSSCCVLWWLVHTWRPEYLVYTIPWEVSRQLGRYLGESARWRRGSRNSRRTQRCLTWRVEFSERNLITLICKKDFSSKKWELFCIPQRVRLSPINKSCRKTNFELSKREF